MSAIHLVEYLSRSTGTAVSGIARVRTDRNRPSWSECADVIPGFVTGTHLGPEPEYTLSYHDADGEHIRRLGAAGVQRVGRILAARSGRGVAWDIAVHDHQGDDITFDFTCFR